MIFGFNRKNKGKKGKFIVLDGIDGSGKTTQIQILAEALQRDGYEIYVADFPQYGKKSAGPVEEYLNGKYGPVNPYICSLFFSVDRYDGSHAIRKALEEGKVVISNRYVTANAGHQGEKITDEGERIAYFKWLDNIEYQIFGIPKPDLNLILHVDAKIAQRQVSKKAHEERAYANHKKWDYHEKDLGHLQRAEKVFLQIAELFPNTKLVECVENGKLLSKEEIHNRIWRHTLRLLQ
jgi:dTMP kinase